ncbi:hypothetical protein DY000_02033010 [Brassica cretica]|uniref:GOLD domain-containing protein n=1 Tax=Brassica cretica TaxID=69181 RepID=A0ABQ7DTH0_BRACR|nr:hypothetical protein DY000_02033010 [Brassica cretica]
MIVSSSITMELTFRIFKAGEEPADTLIVQFSACAFNSEESMETSSYHVHVTSITPADIDFELNEGESCFSDVEHVASLVHEKIKGNIDRLEGKVDELRDSFSQLQDDGKNHISDNLSHWLALQLSYKKILDSVCKSQLSWLCVMQCFNLCNYQVSSVELLQVV